MVWLNLGDMQRPCYSTCNYTLILYPHPIPTSYTHILLFTFSYQIVEGKESEYMKKWGKRYEHLCHIRVYLNKQGIAYQLKVIVAGLTGLSCHVKNIAGLCITVWIVVLNLGDMQCPCSCSFSIPNSIPSSYTLILYPHPSFHVLFF